MKNTLNDLSQLKDLKEKMEADDNRNYSQRREEMKFNDSSEDMSLHYDPTAMCHTNYDRYVELF